MVVRIITIIAAVTATGFFTLAALWFIGFLKVARRGRGFLKIGTVDFNFFDGATGFSRPCNGP